MNTYDPADCIVYLHLASDTGPYGVPVAAPAAANHPAPGRRPVTPYRPAETVTTERHQASPAHRVGARDLCPRSMQREQGE